MSSNIVSQKSVFFEKLVEHRFIADIMMYGWYFHNKEIRILRCEIDTSGYDIVIDCENKYRFIQLRTSALNSKRSYQQINASLISKQNPCVVWIFYDYSGAKNDLEFKYFFWGAEIGKPITPTYNKRKVHFARSKPPKRYYVISRGQFVEVPFNELFGKLFDFVNIPAVLA